MVSLLAPIVLDSKFQRIMNNAPFGAVLLDENRLAVATNRHWTALTGQAHGDLRWKDAIADQDRATVLMVLEALGKTAKTSTQEIRLARADGTTKWVRLDISPESDDDDVVKGWLVTAIDITETREAQQALLAESQRYRLLAETSNDMLVRIGFDGVRRYVSPACERILGYSADELTGATPLAEIHSEDRARVERVCRSLLEGARDPVCSYRQQRRDGTYAWLEASYRLVLDERTGEPQEFVATVRDITARQNAERALAAQNAALQESQRQLNMSEAIAHLGHWSFDLVSGRISWSDEIFRMHGMKPGDAVPTYEEIISRYHPDDRERVGSLIARAQEDGEPYDFRARLIRLDGEIIDVLALGHVEKAPNGQPVALFGILQNITTQVRAERELATARDVALELADAKARFLAMMSHEIRTPVTGLIGLIDLLSAELPADHHMVGAMRECAGTLMTVLDDVLDHAALENGKLQLAFCDSDVSATVQRTVELFRPAAIAKGLDLILDARSVHARADPARVRQIVANFLSNAIKFTDHGVIEVAISVDPAGFARIAVKDTGIGIKEGVLPSLFMPFVQADSSTHRIRGGTGLGLTISRQLAALMSGNVGATSEPGVGSCFWLTLPLAAGPAVHANDASPRHAETGQVALTDTRVLVVDDTETTRLITAAHVAALGCKATSAANGIEAFRHCRAGGFDAIFMDSAMPYVDGATMISALRRLPRTRDAAIIGFTAHTSVEDRARLSAAGADVLLSKPFRPADLERALRTALAQKTRRTSRVSSMKLDRAPTFGRADVASPVDEVQALLERFRVAEPAALARLVDAHLEVTRGKSPEDAAVLLSVIKELARATILEAAE
jgi:PAS domain S-box-containing protein